MLNFQIFMNMNTYKNVRIWVSTPLRIVLFWDRNTFEFELYSCNTCKKTVFTIKEIKANN